MVASATDKFIKVGRSTATTLSAPGYTVGNTSINVASTTNYPTDTGVLVSVDEVDSNGNRISGTYNVFQGVVSSATQISSLDYVGGDTERDYPAGATTRVYITVSSYQVNRLIDGLLVSIDQDGTLKAGAVDNAAALASDVVTTAKILDSNVTSAKVAAGFPVQVVSSNFSAVATGTTVVPRDDTIPQNTEGDQYMTLSITPKSATNHLLIKVTAFCSNSVSNDLVMALFQDTTANALAATDEWMQTATAAVNLSLQHDMVAGTTSSTTFKIRIGGSSAGTTTFNGLSGARLFGSLSKSNITIIEYKP